MRRGVIITILLLIFLTGCSSRRMVRQSETNVPPAKLAILPIDNLTNDVLGAQVLREVVYAAFMENPKGYEVQTLQETDELLLNEGITDGGQLSIIHPIELSEILGTDGLLYIKLEELSLITLPFYHVRKIDMTYRMYNFGKLYSEEPLVVANRFLDINGILKTIDDPSNGLAYAGRGIAIHQGLRFLTAGLAKHELRPEMGMISLKLLRTLPIGLADSKEYREKVEKEILKLREKFMNNENFIPENLENEYIEKKIIEDGIQLIN
ncbi:GNA1162 family protein [uncultured Ilyobacter sp.]|uniref:GNA1162 family protein n=1 Tax=uncultured Ilyobacter sp. TaxID=544433 RepID=UPI0029BFDEDB|nr:GNA1162 family protein [uncultured Ilyobacter sp.]